MLRRSRSSLLSWCICMRPPTGALRFMYYQLSHQSSVLWTMLIHWLNRVFLLPASLHWCYYCCEVIKCKLRLQLLIEFLRNRNLVHTCYWVIHIWNYSSERVTWLITDYCQFSYSCIVTIMWTLSKKGKWYIQHSKGTHLAYKSYMIIWKLFSTDVRLWLFHMLLHRQELLQNK